MSTHILTADELRAQLSYDPLTGVFTRIKQNSGTKRVGKVAGCVDKEGYHGIRMFSVNYRAHRLAWLYVYGEWPSGRIDHKNRVRNDNRISNLRLATPSQNGFNQAAKPNTASGLKGVTWVKGRERWKAMAGVGGGYKFLGYFRTPEAAHQAYCDFVRPIHGEFFAT